MCTTRVGDLNDIYENLISLGILNVKIITIGKEEYSSGVGSWVNSNLPMLVDNSPYEAWTNWDASIRDVYFLNPNGTLFDSYNISASSAVDQIQGTIDAMLAQLEVCAAGDIDTNGSYNVLDIVALADCIILASCEGCAGDLDGNGSYNVLDITALADCILSATCDSL